ncbi:MAG: hypothetical protein KF788_08675 [Piscinibacter sp.]|nr:hypothetical protein [Piscinibacter sp.]
MSYVPQQGSLPARVCQFFLRNRDETLSAPDIVRKFDLATTNSSNVHAQLVAAVNAGALQRDAQGYSAGPKLEEAAGTPGAPPPKARRAPVAEPLDPATVKVEKNVPKPEPARGNKANYRPIIEQLGKGDSVKLPSRHATRLIDYARKLGKVAKPPRTYSLRKIDAQTSRVWRDS